MAPRRKFTAEFKAPVVFDVGEWSQEYSGVMPSASTQPATAGTLEDRICGEGSLALSARSDAKPGARTGR